MDEDGIIFSSLSLAKKKAPTVKKAPTANGKEKKRVIEAQHETTVAAADVMKLATPSKNDSISTGTINVTMAESAPAGNSFVNGVVVVCCVQ